MERRGYLLVAVLLTFVVSLVTLNYYWSAGAIGPLTSEALHKDTSEAREEKTYESDALTKQTSSTQAERTESTGEANQESLWNETREARDKISALFSFNCPLYANPLMHICDYRVVFQNAIKAWRSVWPSQDCHFLDVGGRYGEAAELAGKCSYWIVDINRITSVKDQVLGCDIEELSSCDNHNAQLPKFDIIHSQDTFEHLRRPWVALENMGKLARRGCLLLLVAPFAWRFHAVKPPPMEGKVPEDAGYGDYLRYSHLEFEFLAHEYGGFSKFASGYDERDRRRVHHGRHPNKEDAVKYDKHGGWLESIRAFYVGTKV